MTRVSSLLSVNVFRQVLINCLLLTLFPTFSFAQNVPKMSGKFTQGSLIVGQLKPGTLVHLDNEPLDVTDSGQFVFGFGRDAELEHILSWQNDDGSLHSQEITLTEREYQTQSITGVPQKMVTPAADKVARIQAEAVLVRNARKTVSQRAFFLQKFVAPLVGDITGVYGSQRIFNGTPKRPHFGLDFAGPVGALVYAPADAVVTLTHDDMYYSGGTLIIDHGYGVSSTFIHLSELLVSKGQKVKKGDVIAKVGQGGRSTGPHLDWRINWYNVRIDPQLVLELGRELSAQ